MKKLLCLAAAFCSLIANAYSGEENIMMLQSLENSDHQIEIYFQKSEHRNVSHANAMYKNTPLLVFFHGPHVDKGLTGLHTISQEWFAYWVKKGYTVAAVSFPGFGKSTGPKDFGGPRTLRALHQAIDRIKQEAEVSSFGIIGWGQGSMVALLLSAERSDIRCIVCANGYYDLPVHEKLLEKQLAEKNYDLVASSESLEMRSPMKKVSLIKAPAFLLYRKGNPIVKEEEVQTFAKSLERAGVECKLVLLEKKAEDDAAQFSDEEVIRETHGWIDFHMLQ